MLYRQKELQVKQLNVVFIRGALLVDLRNVTSQVIGLSLQSLASHPQWMRGYPLLSQARKWEVLPFIQSKGCLQVVAFQWRQGLDWWRIETVAALDVCQHDPPGRQIGVSDLDIAEADGVKKLARCFSNEK